jgi:hypothetical protein
MQSPGEQKSPLHFVASFQAKESSKPQLK